ncbi:MAG: amidohydrolase family protein [Bacteroidota bacterium]
MRTYLLCLGALLVLVTTNQAQTTTYLHCGRLIDATSEAVQTEMTIVVVDDEITALESGYSAAPAGVQTIDLRNHTVMPGLIDMHVHVESQQSPNRYLETFTMDPADVALRATTYVERTLLAGFTTVRDLGGTGVNVSLRDAINRGYIDGPRILTAQKAIGTTGGHADPTNGRRMSLTGDPAPIEGVVNSADEAFEAVRGRYKLGADCIKITATGGVLSVASNGSGPQFRQEEVNAIVEAANDYGMHTAAHAHGAEGMRRAVIAGITTIEHGTLMNEEVMDLMIEHGTYLVPTISAGRFVADKAKQAGYFPAIIVPKALEIGSQIQATFGRAYAYGVPIAFGTDSGVSAHGENAQEFAYMVEAGMPAIEAILSATAVPAQILGLDHQIGTIRPGLQADIVAVPGNPLEDIDQMMAVSFVMKGGIVYKH